MSIESLSLGDGYERKRLEQRAQWRRHAAYIEVAIEEKAGSESAPLSEPAQ
jgi:hypothetical protein